MNDGVFARFTTWAKNPFTSDMDAVKWVLFLAFAVTVVILWTRVLKHVLHFVD